MTREPGNTLSACSTVARCSGVAQAQAILASRVDGLEEHSTPKGDDVVNYPLTEPTNTVVLQAEFPWTIVLGLERTWFEVRVVDECGLAVKGLDMRFSANEDALVTTDGIGVARFETYGDPNGNVTIASIAQAHSILAPRWEKVRKPLNLGGPHLSTHQLTDDFPSVALPKRHRHTLVLTPVRTFIEIRIVDDNNNPISGKRAKLFLTDDRVLDTVLEADGVIRAEEIPAGNCRLELPVADRAEWIDPDAPPPEADVEPSPEGHWIVRQDIKSPGPEVAGLVTGEAHVVVVGRKRAEQLEIDDALFRLMSAVLLPEGQSPGADPTEPDGTRPTTLDLLTALRTAASRPKAPHHGSHGHLGGRRVQPESIGVPGSGGARGAHQWQRQPGGLRGHRARTAPAGQGEEAAGAV